MGRVRAGLSVAAALLAIATLALRAQTIVPNTGEFTVRLGVGLPAVDQGALNDESRAPQTAQTLKRLAMHEQLHRERTGATGVPYASGRLLVKFRESASSGADQA